MTVVVQVGADGISDGVISAADQALDDHELIKVKISAEREARDEAVEALAKATKSEVAQTLGKTVLLFRKRKKDSKIEI